MFAGRAVSYARRGGLTQPGLLEHQRLLMPNRASTWLPASVGSESTCSDVHGRSRLLAPLVPRSAEPDT
jgi:hypothetical protein